MKFVVPLILLCACFAGNAAASSTKGVWLPIQSVAGYPNWPDFAAAEASAAEQALMCANSQVPVPFGLIRMRSSGWRVVVSLTSLWTHGTTVLPPIARPLTHAFSAPALYFHHHSQIHPFHSTFGLTHCSQASRSSSRLARCSCWDHRQQAPMFSAL